MHVPSSAIRDRPSATSRLARAVIGIPWALAAWYSGEIKVPSIRGEYRVLAMDPPLGYPGDLPG
jgi:hypothetical protein